MVERAPQVTASTSIVWVRLDLRLADNPALYAAQSFGPVVPVFIWSPEEEAPWQPGAASRWWLHQSLRAFQGQLERLGNRLIIRRGPAAPALLELVRQVGAARVLWNRRYEPTLRERDQRVTDALLGAGVAAKNFKGALLYEPWSIRNTSGLPFKVFTPFWRHCLHQNPPDEPLPAPRQLIASEKWPESLAVEALELEPNINWAQGMRARWTPGEEGARLQLERFVHEAATRYPADRNRPDLPGTSRLSPHLHFGEISPRQIWDAVRRPPEQGNSSFLTELGWREFAHHLLYHFPFTAEQPLRAEFKQFSWREDAAFLKAWQTGRTGYPIIDAGMRELWTTGWMHNRVRMIVASFLVKDLLISWTKGARWFWDTLVDADLAQNTLGWQWSAGCGADAAPFMRVFNPVVQGEKFDPQGDYVRNWCPELASIPDRWVHQPWNAPRANFPKPIIDHRIARDVALEAFSRLKSAHASEQTPGPNI